MRSIARATFRHRERRKNEVWGMLLGLAHNVLSDLRAELPMQEVDLVVKHEHSPAYLPQGWVQAYLCRIPEATRPVRPLLTRVREMALRVACDWKTRGSEILLQVRPDILAQSWFPALMRA